MCNLQKTYKQGCVKKNGDYCLRYASNDYKSSWK